MPQRADQQPEGHDRAEHDHVDHEQPRRQAPRVADRIVDDAGRKRPPRLDHGPEERGEEESVGRERDRIPVLDASLREEDVRRERKRGPERRRDPHAA
jgi:hypothetical protein